MIEDGVWRYKAGRAVARRCPTCEERGREPWRPLEEYSRDVRRASGVAGRCLLCTREDGQYYYAEARERGEPLPASMTRDDRRREQERLWSAERMKDPTKRGNRRETNREYAERQKAAGKKWRFRDGKWQWILPDEG